jgi:DNA-binding transcriptional regulator YdaS (Cro superfamily)
MGPDEYREAVDAIGSQTEVAAILGVTRETVNKRCSGLTEIDHEAIFAICFLQDNPITTRQLLAQVRGERTADKIANQLASLSDQEVEYVLESLRKGDK